ncbi:hypothetical protein ACH0BP_27650 [Bacillus nitratireducens]|uniref:hypothetical protein n=1 Tax=Bacillus nitratireducens TaxID=2026193 RepID=UPI0008FDD2A9|nr:hypothetical protein [Bacillus nitratireducens]OJD55254.1 hypothetical protein BAU23_26880 [Bacillus nitratireducens]
MKEQIHKAWNEGFDLHEAIIASKGSVFEEKITFTKMLNAVEVGNGISCAGFISALCLEYGVRFPSEIRTISECRDNWKAVAQSYIAGIMGENKVEKLDAK